MRRNKLIFSIIAPLILVFAVSGVVFGWGTTGGDASDYRQLQETAVFYNDAGTEIIYGQVVVMDRDAGTAGTTLGTRVDLTSTADNPEVMGVALSTDSSDGERVVVVTRGPAEVYCNDSNDAVNTGSLVGTTNVAGRAGGGIGLGRALEDGNGTDNELIMIWVDPYLDDYTQ